MLGVLSAPLGWLATLLVCLPFAVSAATKLLDQPAALEEMAAGGFPRSLPLLLGIVAYQLLGVALLLTLLAPLAGAALLAAVLFAATVTYHQFWREAGAVRIAKLNHFCENLALIGALAFSATCPWVPA